MAILTGFPPSNTISAGVRITELDFSFVDSATSLHSIGLVGFATKGPINVPTLITSISQLHTIFGYPHPDTTDPYLIYAAEQVLAFTSSVWIVRCGDVALSSADAAITAEVDVPAAGGQVKIIGNENGSFTFSTDEFFRWRLNGVLASKVLTVLAGTYTLDELVLDLNDQLSSVDGIIFYATDTDTLGVKTTFSYGATASLELVSVSDSLYGPTSLVGMGTTMAAAFVTGTTAKYPNNSYQVAGTYDFTGLSNLYLYVVVDGTDNVNIDNVVQQVIITASSQNISAIVSDINDQITNNDIPGGFVASASGNNLKLTTLSYGRDARILVKTTSTAATLFGLSGASDNGASPTAVSDEMVDATYAAAIVTGSANVSSDISLTITADSQGTEGNLTQVVVTNNIRDGNFQFQVYTEGNQVEAWGRLVKDESSNSYVETFIALVSDYIRVIDNTSVSAPPANGTYSLSGGTNGIPTDPDAQDALIIGLDVASTGIYALSDPEQTDIDLLAVPGHASTDVIVALLDVCQNRRSDCFAIIDPPFGLTVNEVVDWQNGTHPLNLTRFDSDFGALYWPWVKIRDTHNRIDVWVPPSGSVLATYVYSDNISHPWFAPAGEVRGLMFNISDTYSKPTLEEKDLMYGYRNCVNPIVRFNDATNFVIWGQKTLQRLPTALDRVNVRRMMLYVEKSIRQQARKILFDPHDETLRQSFITIAKKVLQQVQKDRGINDFFVKCDTELNTSDVIDRNELRAQIGIQPIRAAEFIFIEFAIYRTGSFTESTATF